jgi:transcriptional regulator with XRE-family HTH domain
MPERPIDVPDFGARLAAARRPAGYPTQAAAARAVGMQPNHFNRLERAGRDPAWSTVYRVIVGLGLPLEFFFPDGLILDSARRIGERTADPDRAEPIR